MIEIKPKHNIGDMVWIVTWTGQFSEPCTTCNKTGKIIYNGKEYDCPECRGDGKIRYRYYYLTTQSVVIGYDIKYKYRLNDWNICKDYDNDEFLEWESNSETVMENDEEYYKWIEIEYITRYDTEKEENVFATEEEAKAECEKRNKNKLRTYLK